MKILILGGYGVFGGRLAELLSDIAEAEILICGRSRAKASAFCQSFVGSIKVTPIGMDRSEIVEIIAKHGPNIVVDASGPFQNYGTDPYGVVKACIASGVSYLDFADAAEFVFGISEFDEVAKEAGTFVLSGVSSFPVLTAAVVRELAKDMTITSITGGIAPSPFAGIGLNVMRAVVGYMGAPVKLLRGGQQIEARGLTESLRYTIATPGHVPLRNLRFSLVDVPDLQVIPPEHSSLRDIWMGAGPVPEVLHRMLNILAKARAAFHLPSFVPLSPLFHWVLNRTKFGEHRGGMFVHVKGTQDGESVERSWHLLAEGDDGPYIPSMAIEAIIRKILAGTSPENGARAATHALVLADYDALFEGRSIYTGQRCSRDADAPLHAQILGSEFAKLPPQMQALHRIGKGHVWEGKAQVTRGKNGLARLIGWLVGFPSESNETPVVVKLEPVSNGEKWTRTFGAKSFTSLQIRGKGRNCHLLVERFGIVSVALALVTKEDRLYLVPRRWSVLGIPLPKILLPTGESYEEEQDGVFWFNVTIKAPLVGLIVGYKGWLKPR